ncbi:MAG TPA: GspH/FimT family pseudopilin [Verrucomicrobiae bacterium]|nr:GspH/FimT family pseudopilin [Verrucomicrobiae bacterium]
MTLAIGNRIRRSGFTLIELSIALFIIAIIMAVSVPSFIRSYNASLMNSTGRAVITSCQFARLNAVLRQQKVEFNIDLDRQVIWLTQTDTNETDDADASVQTLKTIEIPSRVGIVSAQVGDQPLQQRGQVEATFYPNGTCDAFQITLRGTEKGSGLAIVVDPVTSRAVPWPVKL